MIKWVLRRAIDLAATAVVGGFWLAAPAAAQVSAQPDAATVYTMTPERIAASTAALVGLIGAVIGGLALVRSARRIGNRTGDAGPSWPWCWGRSAWSSVDWSWPLPTVVLAPATGWPGASSP